MKEDGSLQDGKDGTDGSGLTGGTGADCSRCECVKPDRLHLAANEVEVQQTGPGP